MDYKTQLYGSNTAQTQTVGNSSVQSNAFDFGTKTRGKVRIATTTHAHIVFGTNPTATEQDLLMPTDHIEVFDVRSGEKCAHIGHGAGSGEINFTIVD